MFSRQKFQRHDGLVLTAYAGNCKNGEIEPNTDGKCGHTFNFPTGVTTNPYVLGSVLDYFEVDDTNDCGGYVSC